jgi:hypothetical protein
VADQHLEGSNLAQPDQVKRICKAVGAKALLTGTFTDLGGKRCQEPFFPLVGPMSSDCGGGA